MNPKWKIFARAEDGATAIEYSMIAAFIVLAIVGSVRALGQSLVILLYDKIAAAFN